SQLPVLKRFHHWVPFEIYWYHPTYKTMYGNVMDHLKTPVIDFFTYHQVVEFLKSADRLTHVEVTPYLQDKIGKSWCLYGRFSS
ncbi:MAG: hypothetical protein HQK77_22010, partial [Desulfobacterales bacterium]|nr:hypothetical protein [Desulfobacterales bacterium]